MATLSRCASALVLVLLSATLVQANTIPLDATYRGWYQANAGDAGYHDSSYTDYFAGVWISGTTSEYRNFFVFDLSGIGNDQEITGATLQLETYGGSIGTETFGLFDVMTPISSLIVSGNNRGLTFWDLGGGTAYGSIDITKTADNQYTSQTISIPLTAAFIAAANTARGGQLGLGGAITIPVTTPHSNEYEFLYMEADPSMPPMSASQLILTTMPVPEPSTILLLATGIIGLLVRVRRKRG